MYFYDELVARKMQFNISLHTKIYATVCRIYRTIKYIPFVNVNFNQRQC